MHNNNEKSGYSHKILNTVCSYANLQNTVATYTQVTTQGILE
jgi:hypothetical protein